MADADETVTLYRPVGQKELELIRDSQWRQFPPRLAGQPIFYPVLTEDYAIRIARDWNTKDAASGYAGYVTRFRVRRAYLDRHEVHEVGGRELKEYWIPAEELATFNGQIVGQIEVTHRFGAAAEQSGLPKAALRAVVSTQPYPLLFATISGAHLYGFPSPDSDYDLRGVHILPVREVIGLDVSRETIEHSGIHDGLEIDLVTHDVRKFLLLMLKRNGYVLEQLLSPLVVHSTPEHEELKSLVPGCITRHHAHHYLGFAQTQWDLFAKEMPPRVKPLLCVYRVLLTGTHLMRSGRVEANLLHLNEEFRLPYIDELVARKLSGAEKSRLDDADLAFHRGEYERLRTMLEEACAASQLPDGPSARRALNDLLVRVRMKSLGRA